MIYNISGRRHRTTALSGFYTTLFTIAVPIILQNLMQTFVNMLDTVMVGQLGAVEIASVGLGNQIFFMLNMVLFGISSGGSIFIAQYWGHKDESGIRRTTGIMLSLSFGISLVFTAGALFFPEALIGLYSRDPAVIATGSRYLRFVGISYPVMAISFAYQLAFRATEHVKLPMAATAISLVVNAFFNYVLIFGVTVDSPFSIHIPALGVVGAAVATLIARIVEFLITVIYSYRKKFEPCGSFSDLTGFTRSALAKFLRIAFPVMVNETMWGLGTTFENSIFAHAGTNAIAAFNITGTVSQLTWVFFIGVGNAAGIIIGKQIGAGQDAVARRYAGRFAWFMPLMAVFFALLLYPLSLILPFLFKVDDGILYQAQLMLYVMMVFYPFNAFNMCMIVGVCRSGGDTVYAAFADLFWMWAVAIPLGALTAFVWHGLPWLIFLALQSEQLVKAVTVFIRLRSGRWLHHVSV